MNKEQRKTILKAVRCLLVALQTEERTFTLSNTECEYGYFSLSIIERGCECQCDFSLVSGLYYIGKVNYLSRSVLDVISLISQAVDTISTALIRSEVIAERNKENK